MGKRTGNWCGTYTGVHFWTMDARPDEINIEDIAHALSQICRFNGHSKYFYSVAQHSINVAKLMERDNKSKKEQLFGLIHDASEAYLCDIPRPFKPFLKDYKEIEDTIQKTIYEAFNIVIPSKEEKYSVKFYDDAVLYLEAKELMNGYETWNLKKTDLDCNIKLEAPHLVELTFIKIFNELLSAIDSDKPSVKD